MAEAEPEPETGARAGARTLMPAFAGRRLSWFGLCTTHVWIYCVLHRSNLNFGSIPTETVFYLSQSLFLLAIAILAYRKQPVAASLRTSIAVATLMIPATAVLTFPFAFTSGAVSLIAALAGGIGIGWCYMQWAVFYARLDIEDAAFCIFTTLIIGSAAKAVVNYLPPEAATVILALCPFISLFFCFDARSHEKPSRKHSTHYDLTTIRSLSKIMLGVAMYGFIVGIVRGLDFQIAGDSYGIITTLHHLAEIGMGAFMLAWIFKLKRTLDVSSLWRIVVVVTMLGLLVLSLAGPELGAAAYMTIATAQTFIVMFFWLMLSDIAHHSKLHPYTVFGAGWIAYTLPLCGGVAVAHALQPSPAGSLVIVLAYLVSMTMIFLLNDKNFSRQRLFADLSEPPVEISAYSAIDRSCVQIGEEFNLTPREVEVMQLLCKGRSKSFIAETFLLSENTVRSHSKNLYRKLEVHSVQEMLALITQRWTVPIDSKSGNGSEWHDRPSS